MAIKIADEKFAKHFADKRGMKRRVKVKFWRYIKRFLFFKTFQYLNALCVICIASFINCTCFFQVCFSLIFSVIQYYSERKKGVQVPTRNEMLRLWYNQFMEAQNTTMEELIKKSNEKSRGNSDGNICSKFIIDIELRRWTLNLFEVVIRKWCHGLRGGGFNLKQGYKTFNRITVQYYKLIVSICTIYETLVFNSL